MSGTTIIAQIGMSLIEIIMCFPSKRGTQDKKIIVINNMYTWWIMYIEVHGS